MGHRVYVGNIPFSIDEGGLREFFGDGVDGCEVTAVKIVTDRATGKPRGIAFIEFSRVEHARRAIEVYDGNRLGGRRVVVNEARAERRTAPAPRPAPVL